MKIAHRLQTFAAVFALAGAAAPALADVKAGVDAWSRGDFAVAVQEWREPAREGDADAQFNLGQAYRLGRGVESDPAQAEVFYAKAAAQGHIKAAENLGLMLFQSGRREEALPYVTAASDRGDPRAQYLLGIAHFNGDMVEKDWVRAYALLTLANAAGLPQAGPAIQQMDDYISLTDRQEAQALAQSLKRESDAARAQQLAAADLALGGETAAVTPPPALRQVQPPAVPATSGRVPASIPNTGISPSVASAQAAIEEASRVTGTSTPAQAGADFARPVAAPPQAPPSQSVATSAAATPPPSPPAPSPPEPSPQPTPQGVWRVQLGAFSVSGNAERMWRNLSGEAALAGKAKILVPTGRLTKLQAGGFASRGDAQAACTKLKARGHACLVAR